MKRMMCAILVLALLLCGCQSAAAPGGETQAQPEETAGTESQVAFNEVDPPAVTIPFTGLEIQSGEPLTLGRTGCARVPYTHNISSVRYVTEAAQLPDYDALKEYDDAYFEDKALLVVLETVGSGSVRVGIESVVNGVVTLSRELPGDAGTADMAAWVLWAEVEQGLDFAWSVANPALQPDGAQY